MTVGQKNTQAAAKVALCTAPRFAFCHVATRPTHSGSPGCPRGTPQDTLDGPGG
jgi:hypothetical protein